MPIYVYQCQECNQEHEILQKLTDKGIEQCPSCNSNKVIKQVTAAGFSLKGSGWYATDFKNNQNPKKAATSENPQTSKTNSSENKTADISKAEKPKKPCGANCGCHK